jgi:hypothetical protein
MSDTEKTKEPVKACATHGADLKPDDTWQCTCGKVHALTKHVLSQWYGTTGVFCDGCNKAWKIRAGHLSAEK